MENELVADTPVADLRDWARGLHPLVAATELLIRTRKAQTWRPWVLERDHGGWWIDFEAIPRHLGELSGGERRLLLLASSLGGQGMLVSLEDTITGLDRPTVDLVLAALAHAAGTHDQTTIEYDDDGKPLGFIRHEESLHPWPE